MYFDNLYVYCLVFFFSCAHLKYGWELIVKHINILKRMKCEKGEDEEEEEMGN